MLEAEIRHLTSKINKNELARSQAKWHDKGETINKYWMATQETRRPRDLIHTLTDPQTGGRSTNTSEMAGIAGTYHDDLQRADLLPPDDPTRQEAQASVLQGISPEHHFNDPTPPLHDLITEHQVLQAMKLSKNGTAMGLDGILYELWKATIEYNTTQRRDKRPSFDLIKCLCAVYNDIQTNGMDRTTGFSNGWMCLIYKKKDRTRIENYRPTTLLNTDTIFTKVLATQLAQQACHLLHPDQTGFVPNRSVFDPIRLAETMCEYAEYMENGAIIALDQEKAYDKIDHQYLFDTLRTFHLPDLFIKTVESLYANAFTQVAINGVLSAPYHETRGVRQTLRSSHSPPPSGMTLISPVSPSPDLRRRSSSTYRSLTSTRLSNPSFPFGAGRPERSLMWRRRKSSQSAPQDTANVLSTPGESTPTTNLCPMP